MRASLNACLGQVCPIPSSGDSEDGNTHSLTQKFLLSRCLLSPLDFLSFLFLFHLSPTTCAGCDLRLEPQRPSRWHSAATVPSYLPSPRAGSCLSFIAGAVVCMPGPGVGAGLFPHSSLRFSVFSLTFPSFPSSLP